MTISTTDSRFAYSGDAVTVAFSFPRQFVATTDLVVILTDEDDGSEAVQTINTHYTVAGTGLSNGIYASGTVTFVTAPGSDKKVIIYRAPPLTQTSDFTAETNPLTALNHRIDLLTLQMQRLDNARSRSLRLSEGFWSTFDATLPDVDSTAGVVAGMVPALSSGLTSMTWATPAAGATVSAAMVDVVTATTRRNGAAELAEGLNIFQPQGTLADGATDNTSAIQAAVTAALAAVSGGAPGAIIYLGPGHWRTTTRFTINEPRISVVMADPACCTVEQLTWGEPVWVFSQADNCSITGGRGLNSQTKTVLSSALSAREFAEVKRTVAAFVLAYDCDYFDASHIKSQGFVETVSLIGAARLPVSGVSDTTTSSDEDSLVLAAAHAQSNDYYNGWYALLADDGASAASNWTVISDYDAATNTASVSPPFTTSGPAKTVTSITRSGATATATVTSHGYSNGFKIYMAGAAQSEYNGVFTITNVAANTFDYTVSGTPASPATTTTALSAAKCLDPTSGSPKYILRSNVQTVGVRVDGVASDSCDFDVLYLDQDDYVIENIQSVDFEQSQGVTAHAVYGSGDHDTDYYKNGRGVIRNVSGSGGHGDLVKVRGTATIVSGLQAERCRSILALERCDNAQVSDIHGYNLGEYYGGQDTAAYGYILSDCKNTRVDNWSAHISSVYASASQPFYGAAVEYDVRACSDISIGAGRFTSDSTAAAGGRALYTGANASPGPLGSLARVSFDSPEIVQNGSGAVIGASLTKGSDIRLILPRSSGLTGDLFAISSGVTAHVLLDEEMLHSGWARTNSGTTTLAYVPRSMVTWTPVLAGTGGSANTYSTQTGFLKDLGGGLVYVQFRIVLTALNATGNLKITGFPRTFNSTYYGQLVSAFEIDNMTSTIDYQVVGQGSSGTTEIALRKRSSTSGGSAAFAAGDASATMDMVMSGVLFIGDVAV